MPVSDTERDKKILPESLRRIKLVVLLHHLYCYVNQRIDKQSVALKFQLTNDKQMR